MKRGVRHFGSTMLLSAVALTFVSSASCAERAAHHPVTLGHGLITKVRWGVEASRSSGKRGGKRPCIGVSVVKSGNSDQNFGHLTRICSALFPHRLPNIVTESTGVGSKTVTAVGIGFARQVMTAEIEFGTGLRRKISPKLLSIQQAQIAGVRRFRYAAFASKGVFCLKGATTYNATGEELFKGPVEACPEG